jgi:hypothetical protein
MLPFFTLQHKGWTAMPHRYLNPEMPEQRRHYDPARRQAQHEIAKLRQVLEDMPLHLPRTPEFLATYLYTRNCIVIDGSEDET